MKKLLLAVLVMILTISTTLGAAAPGFVRGRVTDVAGEPIPGAVVIVAGDRSSGVVTGADGAYSLKIKDGNATIEASCLGYKTATEKVSGRENINFILSDDNQLLEETVVIAYGTQKKVNLTGSVASIDFGKMAEGRTIVSTSSALAGLASGMNVTQSSGQPGSESATIRIRGIGSFTSSSCSPLVLVDGVEWSMDNINPNDIANISVLKDAASTAIYGTRAANGVILITTKTGVEGKPQISYSYKHIFQKAYNKLQFVSDYVRYMELFNESKKNLGAAVQFQQTTIDTWKNAAEDPEGLNVYGVPNYLAYPSTDWFAELFQTGNSQEHNINISGGNKGVKYMVSASYLDNEGVMGRFGIDSSTKVFNVRSSVDAKVTDWFSIGTKIFGQYQTYGLAGISGAFTNLVYSTPGYTIGEPNAWGVPAIAGESSNANNPFRSLVGSGGYNHVTRLNATAYAKFTPFKGFSIEATGNYAPTYQDKHTYSVENGQWDYVHGYRASSSLLETAGASNASAYTQRLSAEVLAKYEFEVGDNSFNALAGYSNMQYSSWGYGVSKINGTDWSLNDLSTYAELNNYSNSPHAGWALQSYFGRVNYIFRDRYLFEANIRADGSSKFGSNNRYGIFPSFSAGWKISEEDFMSGTKGWLDNLKIRASWGQAGNNQGIGNYAWQSTYATTSIWLDGAATKGLYQSSLSNADLKWETTTTTDLGIDAGFFKNRLTTEIDGYYKNTTDILYTPSVYLTMGEVSGVPANLGAVLNKGVEVSIKWRDGIGKDFAYNIGVNASWNTNVVTLFKGDLVKSWDDDHKKYTNNLADVTESFGSGKICEGHKLGEYYIYSLYTGSGEGYTGGMPDPSAGPVDGMIRTESDFNWVKAMMAAGYKFRGLSSMSKDQLWYGDFIYADADGDGNYGDTDDMNFNGHTATPDYNLGVNLGCSWKGFDLSMVWSGAFGFHILWNSAYVNAPMTTSGRAIGLRVANDHYYLPTDSLGLPNFDSEDATINATYPRLTCETALGNSLSSNFYEYRGDYIKLKNAQFGYTVPSKYSQKIHIQNARIFVSGENLITITSFPGMDPEKGANVGYPLMRQFTVGAQVTF